jgi:hypothetical protein
LRDARSRLREVHRARGRSSKQFLPRSWRSKRDGLSPYLRTSGARGLTPAPRRPPRRSTRSRPFSACLRPCDGPPRGFGERGGRKWARNSPKLRTGRDREAAGRRRFQPQRPGQRGRSRTWGGDSPTPPRTTPRGRGQSANRSRVGSSTPRGLLPIISGLGAQSPRGQISPGVRGPGEESLDGARPERRALTSPALTRCEAQMARGARIRPGPPESQGSGVAIP